MKENILTRFELIIARKADPLFHSVCVGDRTFSPHRDRGPESEVFPMFAGCRLLFRFQSDERWEALVAPVFCPLALGLSFLGMSQGLSNISQRLTAVHILWAVKVGHRWHI